MSNIVTSSDEPSKAKYYSHKEYQPKKATYGFFTSHGGVSCNTSATVKNDKNENTQITSAYSSLNVGIATDDDRTNIAKNIRIAYEAILNQQGNPVNNTWLVINETTYSDKVLTITDENIEQIKESNKFDDASGLSSLNSFCSRIKTDAFVTNSKDIILATVGADAHSIILIDEESGVTGIMAGSWKGMAKGLYEKVVESMKTLGAKTENIVTIIGAGLAKENYEFSSDQAKKSFYAAEQSIDNTDNVSYKPNPEYQAFFEPKDTPGKCTINLSGLVEFKAKEIGLIKGCLDLSIDTMKDINFYGARRATQEATKAPDSTLHKIITGRNLNFTSLVNSKNSSSSLPSF